MALILSILRHDSHLVGKLSSLSVYSWMLDVATVILTWVCGVELPSPEHYL